MGVKLLKNKLWKSKHTLNAKAQLGVW